VENYQGLEAQDFDGVITEEGDGTSVAVPFRGDLVQILEISKDMPPEAT